MAGAWGRPRWLGDAAGPAQRLPRALLPEQRDCPHCGLPMQSGAQTRKPHYEFCALPKPQRRRGVPATEHCLRKPGLGSLIHIPGTKPPASLRPRGRARPDFTRSHTDTQHPGCEVDSHYLAWFVPLLQMSPRPCVLVSLGLQLCPSTNALLLLRVVFGRGTLEIGFWLFPGIAPLRVAPFLSL